MEEQRPVPNPDFQDSMLGQRACRVGSVFHDPTPMGRQRYRARKPPQAQIGWLADQNRTIHDLSHVQVRHVPSAEHPRKIGLAREYPTIERPVEPQTFAASQWRKTVLKNRYENLEVCFFFLFCGELFRITALHTADPRTRNDRQQNAYLGWDGMACN
jgi:hypothetical protein